MKVYRRRDEDFDSLFNRFKRSVQQSGVLIECKKHEYFMSPRDKKIFNDSLKKNKKRSK